MDNRISSKSPKAINIAFDIIKNGGLIIYPTDTLYGFGGDARKENVINNINNLKKRTGPISILVSNLDMAFDVLDLNSEEKKMVGLKIGGGNTVIGPAKNGVVSDKILGEDATVGVRIPDHTFGTQLVEKLGSPITTTSVNETGKPPLNNPEQIMKQFGSSIDLLIDDGPLPNPFGSKIYKLVNSTFELVR